jgi:hypothetical protein
VASTSKIAPSHAARLRITSAVKSTWPGVSIRLSWYSSPSGPVCNIRPVCSLTVMPRSRSMSMSSSSCARLSRSGNVPVHSMSRSASVDLPWSMWAMMQKSRIRATGVVASALPSTGVLVIMDLFLGEQRQQRSPLIAAG